jgi:hypothetical protein
MKITINDNYTGNTTTLERHATTPEDGHTIAKAIIAHATDTRRLYTITIPAEIDAARLKHQYGAFAAIHQPKETTLKRFADNQEEAKEIANTIITRTLNIHDQAKPQGIQIQEIPHYTYSLTQKVTINGYWRNHKDGKKWVRGYQKEQTIAA